MTSTHIRQIKQLIEGFGGKIVKINQSKNYKVTYSVKGVELYATFSVTPSDARWMLNKKADIKRDLKQRGLWG
jgi:hypothetical protein